MIKKVGVSFGVKALTLGLSTTFGLVLPSFMVISEYGMLLATLNLVNLFVLVASMGMPTFILKHYSSLQSVHLQNKHRDSISLIYILTAIILSIPLFLVSLHLNGDWMISVSLTGLAICILGYKIFSVFYQVDSQQITYQILSQSIRPACWVLALLLLWVFSSNLSFSSALGFEILIALCIALYVVPKFTGGFGRVKPKLVKLVYVNSASLGMISIILGVGTKIELIMVDYLLTTTDVAIYGYSLKVAGLADMFILAALIVFSPKIKPLLQKNEFKAVQSICSKVCLYNVWFTAIFFAFFYAVGQSIFSTLLPDMVDSYNLTLILLVSKLFSALFSFAAVMAMLTVDKKPLLIGSIMIFILNIFVCQFFILQIGIIGVAISNLIVAVFSNMLLCFLVWKKNGIRTFVL